MSSPFFAFALHLCGLSFALLLLHNAGLNVGDGSYLPLYFHPNPLFVNYGEGWVRGYRVFTDVLGLAH